MYPVSRPPLRTCPPPDPAAWERQSIRRTGNALGLTFVFLDLGSNLLLVLLSLLLAGSSAREVLYSPLYDWGIQILFTTLSFTIPFVICARVRHFRLEELILLRRTPARLLIPLTMICMGLFALGNVGTTLIQNLLGLFGLTPSMPQLTDLQQNGWSLLIIALVSAALPALCEEFALRGVVLGVTRRFGDGFAIFLSAVMFGLMHGNLVQIPFAFISGLALGYVTVAAGSLWPSMLAHFTNNLMATLLDQWIPADSVLSNLYSLFYHLLLCGMGLVGFVLLVRRQPESFHLPAPRTILSFGKKLGAFVATPGMILFFVLTALKIWISGI